MKIKVLFFLFIAFEISGCFLFNKQNGNGVLKVKHFSTKPFTNIFSNGAFNVKIFKSDSCYVDVETDENLMESLIVLAGSNQKLKIGLKPGNYTFTKMNINVFCPSVKELSISGSGDVSLGSDFILDSLIIGKYGSGRLNVNGLHKYLKLESAGSGSISIGGIIGTLDLYKKGSGSINALNSKITDLNFTCNGSGDIEFDTLQKMTISKEGSGSVYYKGKPYLKVLKNEGTGLLEGE